MTSTVEPSTDMMADSMLNNAVDMGETLAQAFHARLLRIGNAGADLDAFLQALATSGLSVGGLTLRILLVLAACVAAHAGARHLAANQPRAPLRLLLPPLACAVLGLGAAWLLGDGPGPLRRALGAWALLGLAALVARDALAWIMAVDGTAPGGRTRPLLADLAGLMSFALVWSLAGIGVITTLRIWGVGAGLRDVIGTGFIAIPVCSMFAYGYARHGAALAAVLAGPRPRTRFRRLFARRWAGIASAFVVMAFLLIQLSATVGQQLPPVAYLVTLVLVLLVPHLDARMAHWAASGLAKRQVPVGVVALRRTARPALLTLCLTAIIAVWASPLATATGMEFSAMAKPAVHAAGAILIAAYLLNLTGAATDRALVDETSMVKGPGDAEEAEAPRSRLSTVLPLLSGAFKLSLLALTALTVLLALGVNVWPLVTGLSVFGLAIGFGSQTLVKDVVSGLFFLFDDAFRLGEYIETSGAKGTVEKISIRSLSVRHPRGALATIPYGQIGKIQNYSRDWVIEKLSFRVAFDTDVDQVRKLFKTIGQDIMSDPEIARTVIEPFKSQGISEVEDGTIVIRGKFKALAGQQFAARKAVLAAVQKAFREHGIKAVPRPLSSPA